jgi:hypothetical protein
MIEYAEIMVENERGATLAMTRKPADAVSIDGRPNYFFQAEMNGSEAREEIRQRLTEELDLYWKG